MYRIFCSLLCVLCFNTIYASDPNNKSQPQVEDDVISIWNVYNQSIALQFHAEDCTLYRVFLQPDRKYTVRPMCDSYQLCAGEILWLKYIGTHVNSYFTLQGLENVKFMINVNYHAVKQEQHYGGYSIMLLNNNHEAKDIAKYTYAIGMDCYTIDDFIKDYGIIM